MTPWEFAQLAAAVRRGDEKAFAVLWEQTNPTLLRYHRVVARDHAELAAAATWRRLAREMARFRGTEQQWQVRVFALARREAGQLDGGRGVISAPSAGRRIDEVVLDVALDVLGALQPSEREVLVLRASAGLSVAQVSEVTGMSQPSVRAVTRNALARASLLASDPAVRRCIDRGAPVPPEEYDGTLLGPMPSDTALEDLLARRQLKPGTSTRTRLMAAIVATLAAPPMPVELRGSELARAAFLRQSRGALGRGRPMVRLGSRTAVAAGIASIAMSGAIAAAYGGLLPGGLQDVAHDWLHAPAANSQQHDSNNAPATSGSSATAPAGAVATTLTSSTTVAGHGGGQPGVGSQPNGTHGGGAPGAAVTSPAAGNPHPTRTNAPPGSTNTPPGSTKTPPGSTKTPPAGSKTAPGSTTTPPGSTRTPSTSPHHR